LQRGATRKLTLISAPAGFGKTSLLSEWISECGYRACWLSLDERDNDPTRFLQHLIFALREIENDLGDSALIALQSSQPKELEILVASLINEIAATPQPFVIVLDDYHLITEPKIQEVLLFLIEHQPRQMHLIISSRADPPWPLSRLRVRGEVLEIRSQEMRFTLQETAAFLNDSLGLGLAPETIAVLEKKTEGWIAGLQMAAISMKDREDITGFIHAFTGSHRFVMDYLVEEVLSQQPADIRDFLLKTSILERLTGSLCDVIVEGENSQSILSDLEQKNLFLIPLDEQRRWYRYHHLFADLLQNQLQQIYPEDVTRLHHRASIWYGMRHLLPDAIRHALAAKDIERVIHLTRGLMLDSMNDGDYRDLMRWLNSLPETELNKSPWLWVARAQGFFKLGQFDKAETALRKVESVISTRPAADKMRTHIQGHIAAIRCYLAEISDDPRSTIRQAENALALLPENEVRLRAYISIRRANCLVWFGEFQEAISAYKKAGAASKQINDAQTAIIAFSEMAVVQMIAGYMEQAIANIDDIHQYAEEVALRDGRRPPAMGVLYRHMSLIKRELNELSEARYYSEEAVKICKHWGENEALAFGLLALARVKIIQGHHVQVDRTLNQMMQIAGQISHKAVAQFQNWVRYLKLIRGDVEETHTWVQKVGFIENDVFGYERRYEYQNYARFLAAKGKYAQAQKVVDRLYRVSAEVGNVMDTIQYKTLQAVIFKKMNKPEEALSSLGEALSRSQPGGYIRAILDEGTAVVSLLRMAVARDIQATYAAKLLSAFQNEPEYPTPQNALKVDLVEPLSVRETEVLRLLMTDLPTSEIARELVISVSTVRSHIKHIYSKLGVHSRYEAISKGKQLNLL
jgi:LuxR family maltose regulon positive regulatory protein